MSQRPTESDRVQGAAAMDFKSNSFLHWLFLTVLLIPFSAISLYGQPILVDASASRQTIIGLGVNANPQSWNADPAAVKKVIDQLVDSLGCTSFRLMFDDCDWEKTNDNDDPEIYNWAFYDSLYSSERFTGIWEMIRYLNGKGVTEIGLSPDGAAPAWMGVTTLQAGKEAEYAEMMSSMVSYARQRLKPAIWFNELSPINESSCGGGEGVVTTKAQFATIYRLIARRLIRDSIPELYITGPDDCGGWQQNFEAMIESPETMSRLRYFGQHDYGNETAKARELISAVKRSPYPGRPVIMSEVNAVCVNCDGGVYNKDYGYEAYARPALQYILQDLNEGISGIQVWEAYDSRYHHPNRTLTWSMWGIFAVNDTSNANVYTKRPHFEVLKHLYRFVKPGYRRIALSSTPPNIVVSAFCDSAGKKLVITGMNNGKKSRRLQFRLQGIPSAGKFTYYSSDSARLFEQRNPVEKKQRMISIDVPVNGIFTLSSE